MMSSFGCTEDINMLYYRDSGAKESHSVVTLATPKVPKVWFV
jgi:hypothetical protein